MVDARRTTFGQEDINDAMNVAKLALDLERGRMGFDERLTKEVIRRLLPYAAPNSPAADYIVKLRGLCQLNTGREYES